MNSVINSLGVKYGALWRVLYVLLLGQLVSFSMSLMNFSSSQSTNLGVNSPFALAFCSYLTITLVFGSILLYSRRKLHLSWYWYVLLAFVDVQGKYLVNKAFQLSSITSVTLLGCWTIVWVIILTWLFLGTKYSVWQFLGAVICVSGLCLVLLSDSGVGGGGGSNPVLGDALVIAGTCFFALSNVGEEFCVKKVDRVEVLAMFGLFGMIVSLIEMAIFESKSIQSISWSPEVVLTFAGFRISGFIFISLTPLVLQESGATLYSLSLLTADMWAVVIRVFLYHQKISWGLGHGIRWVSDVYVDWLYFVSFLFVGIGLIIYPKTEKHSTELPKPETDEPDQSYQLLA